MAANSKIEWTDATWNPITGCSVTSPGCTNCYAMRLAGTRLKHHHSRAGLTVESKAGPVWNGEVRLNEAWLDQPLRMRRPRRIFVCAHGDLFHEQVPDEWIDRVMIKMIGAKHHILQVLTKRSTRMRAYMMRFKPDGDGYVTRDGRAALGAYPRGWPIFADDNFPPKHIWLGVSVEDRARLKRLEDLRHTPSAVRFVSFEPLLENLGVVDLSGIRWLIVGGESGPDARPMHPDWARSLRDQCQAAGVPFFFKQHGEWIGNSQLGDLPPGWDVAGCYFDPQTAAYRIGKRAAGRLLDGREWNEMPR